MSAQPQIAEADTTPCTGRDLSSPTGDLTWLLHKAAQVVRTELDGVSQEHGLTSMRDWLLLTALTGEKKRTQLALANDLALDKTTLTSMLDRLERDGYIVRTPDPRDRRAKLPEITESGRELQAKLVTCRDAVEERLLAAFDDQQRHTFFDVLATIAWSGVRSADCEKAHGSCM